MKFLLIGSLLLSLNAFADIEGGYCGQAAKLAAAGVQEASSISYQVSRADDIESFNVTLFPNVTAMYKKGINLQHTIEGQFSDKVKEVYIITEELGARVRETAKVTVVAHVKDSFTRSAQFCSIKSVELLD